MVFKKNFPKKIEGSNYPEWVEVGLTKAEEIEEEALCREENIALMEQCIEDAKKIIVKKDLKEYQTDLINIAIALFEKRASYSIHYKENRAREKFDKQQK